jgi:hypothetical protein
LLKATICLASINSARAGHNRPTFCWPSEGKAKLVCEKACEQLIVGSGQIGDVPLSPEGQAHLTKKNCKVLLQPIPVAIDVLISAARQNRRD